MTTSPQRVHTVTSAINLALAPVSLLSGIASLLVVLGLLAGCSTKADYSARFIGYTNLPDGTRVALVAPVQQSDDRQTAFTDIPDLRPGELVLIHYTGRSWDIPQSTPEREILSRAPGR